ncbi:YihY/virulence factor BrkB family protein [Gemmobacter lutimaris]|uniref:YihY/virulence factor BrkB family protein n=1 Tax=Gemmobacter lutimaris TaxID=2306023 RepID=A0A398BJV2_9RHOB|nr:YihY/virulence factor BrkB family protein [Gemmobacter lutimaris]RID90979.1 YihY/virulence factor BrkB family protein [Gemmobacter lutimaris]
MFQRLKRRLVRIMARASQANLGMVAAGVAFFGFLSIFPAMAFVMGLWSFAADPAVIRDEMAILADFLPHDAFSVLNTQVEALLAAGSSELGWTTILSLMVAFWSARSGVAGMVSGLNAVHHHPDRSGVYAILLSMALTLMMVVIALAALLASIVAPVLLRFLPLGPFASLALDLGNMLLALGLLVLGLALTYRFGPNRPDHIQVRLFTRGLLVAMVLWFAVSRGFVLYLANFNSYNQVYGSIGAVVILMMWLYLSAYAVLLGAAVDAEAADVPEPGLPPAPDQ